MGSFIGVQYRQTIKSSFHGTLDIPSLELLLARRTVKILV